jgi:predicted nucleotide-binding protein
MTHSTEENMDKKAVMVIHGRDEDRVQGFFNLLRSMGLIPLEWGELATKTGVGAPYVGEVLDAAFTNAAAVVVLLTGDDLTILDPDYRRNDDQPFEAQLTSQPRPNVLFEAGMAFAKHPEKTLLVQIGHIKPFSDIGGRYILKLDNSKEKRQELMTRLSKAGCDVCPDGGAWLTVGNFDVEPGKKRRVCTIEWSESWEIEVQLFQLEDNALDAIKYMQKQLYVKGVSDSIYRVKSQFNVEPDQLPGISKSRHVLEHEDVYRVDFDAIKVLFVRGKVK